MDLSMAAPILWALSLARALDGCTVTDVPGEVQTFVLEHRGAVLGYWHLIIPVRGTVRGTVRAKEKKVWSDPCVDEHHT